MIRITDVKNKFGQSLVTVDGVLDTVKTRIANVPLISYPITDRMIDKRNYVIDGEEIDFPSLYTSYGKIIFDGKHVWGAFVDGDSNGKLVKFNTETKQYVKDLGFSGSSDPGSVSLTFDGTKIWVWAANGTDLWSYDVNSYQVYYSSDANYVYCVGMCSDGTNIWMTEDDGAGGFVISKTSPSTGNYYSRQALTIPIYNSLTPIAISNPIFDGKYIRFDVIFDDSSHFIIHYKVNPTTNVVTYDSLNFVYVGTPTYVRIVFDGTLVWSIEPQNNSIHSNNGDSIAFTPSFTPTSTAAQFFDGQYIVICAETYITKVDIKTHVVIVYDLGMTIYDAVFDGQYIWVISTDGIYKVNNRTGVII